MLLVLKRSTCLVFVKKLLRNIASQGTEKTYPIELLYSWPLPLLCSGYLHLVINLLAIHIAAQGRIDHEGPAVAEDTIVSVEVEMSHLSTPGSGEQIILCRD